MTDAIELTTSTFVIKSATLRHHLDEHGEPWFVAKDVCDYLELENPSQAYKRVPDEDRGVSTIDTPSGSQQMVIVNEPGLYRLIFESRKPEAEAFKRWVFRELLPSLRRNGYYRLSGHSVLGMNMGGGKGKLGRQPFADVLRQRGISQRAAREAMNQLDLPVPQVPDTKYGNVIYGSARPSRAFAVRASAYLGMPANELFTTEPRD
jgi:prophage antirepressor-like protein